MKLKSIIILLCVAFVLSAQNSQVKNLESQRKKELEEIEVIKQSINETSNSKKNVLYRLNLLSQQIMLRKKVIVLLNGEIEGLNKEIKATEKEIKRLEAELEYKKTNYAKSLQRMFFHKNNVQDKFLFILAGKDFAQSYRRMRYLREYAGWQKEQGVQIVSQQKELNIQQKKLVAKKNDKIALMRQKEIEENNLKQEENTRQGEIKTLTAQEKDLRKELDKKKKQAEALNRRIEQAIAEEVARANAEVEKARQTNESGEIRKADFEGGYAMTKEERQLSSNFANNRGRLPYPLKGKRTITGYFGLQKPDGLPYVTLNNNGIDIRTTANNDAKSVFDGEVTKIFTMPGYNKSIIVRHGNYLTVYSNLSDVCVSVNEKVKTGQNLGKIDSDYEDGNYATLHFELWRETTKLNPINWLSK